MVMVYAECRFVTAPLDPSSRHASPLWRCDFHLQQVHQPFPFASRRSLAARLLVGSGRTAIQLRVQRSLQMRSDHSQNDASSQDAAFNPTQPAEPRSSPDTAPNRNDPTASSSSISTTHAAPANARRPPPSPAQSPDLSSGPRFQSALSATDQKRQTAYKRARTVSPIIDENSSDLENEVRSIYSRSNSDLGEQEAAEAATSAQQPTPPPS